MVVSGLEYSHSDGGTTDRGDSPYANTLGHLGAPVSMTCFSRMISWASLTDYAFSKGSHN